MFEAVILMGGFGTRLKDVSGDMPKPMVPVGGEPFVYKLMRKLESEGCVKIVLSLHFRAEYVVKLVERDMPVKCAVVFVIEEEPLGTGGAIKLAARAISSDYFIAINGDTFCEIDYAAFYTQNRGHELAIAGVYIKDASRYGFLELDGNMNIRGMREKGISGEGYINSGSYLIARRSIIDFPASGFSFENDYIGEGRLPIKCHLVSGTFIDIGIPEDYFRACEILV